MGFRLQACYSSGSIYNLFQGIRILVFKFKTYSRMLQSAVNFQVIYFFAYVHIGLCFSSSELRHSLYYRHRTDGIDIRSGWQSHTHFLRSG